MLRAAVVSLSIEIEELSCWFIAFCLIMMCAIVDSSIGFVLASTAASERQASAAQPFVYGGYVNSPIDIYLLIILILLM